MFLISNLRRNALYGRGVALLVLSGLSLFALTGCNGDEGGKPIPSGAAGTKDVHQDAMKAPIPAGQGTQESTFVQPGEKK